MSRRKMTKEERECRAVVRKAARQLGVPVVEFGHGGAHAYAVLDVDGKHHRYAFSCTTSDHRSQKNISASMKRKVREWRRGGKGTA